MNVLGALYKPSGLALETAQAVLEIENPYAVNVAIGCTNQCRYCYLPKAYHIKRGEMRFPLLMRSSHTHARRLLGENKNE